MRHQNCTTKTTARTVFKQYDSIEFVCYMTNDDDSVYDLNGLILAADMVSTTNITHQMQVDITNASIGAFVISTDETGHAVGKYKLDVLIEIAPGEYKSTDDEIEFWIERAITTPRPSNVIGG